MTKLHDKVLVTFFINNLTMKTTENPEYCNFEGKEKILTG